MARTRIEEFEEVDRIRTQLANTLPEYPDVSQQPVKIGGVTYTVQWLRYYGFIRHTCVCMKMATVFANIRTKTVVREVLSQEHDLRLLRMNALFMRRELRAKGRKEARHEPQSVAA